MSSEDQSQQKPACSERLCVKRTGLDGKAAKVTFCEMVGRTLATLFGFVKSFANSLQSPKAEASG